LWHGKRPPPNQDAHHGTSFIPSMEIVMNRFEGKTVLVNARIGMPNSSVYAASKAALISLAKTLSAELLPRGVRVNVVSPGPVTTPLYGKLGFDAAMLETVAAQNQIPLGRFGKPEEIASTVLHLSLPESGFIVGTEIIADGGMSQL
jgi:NAD(P)-dependent dehydrogenase (short-subunit alcohol dehydrogenase family)